MSGTSLDAFERHVAAGRGEEAYACALAILREIDGRGGRLIGVEMRDARPEDSFERRVERVATRFCAAFGQLVCDRSIPLPHALFEALAAHHRWIELLFSNSGFRSSGHLVARLGEDADGGWTVRGEDLRRFFLLFSPASGLEIDFAQCMQADPAAAASAFLNYLGTRYCFTEPGWAFRERLLEWLPERLDAVTLGDVALRRVAEPYMHCSYAQTPRKHDIKAALVAQVRRACLDAGCREYDPGALPIDDARPTVVVTTEHFSEGHSVHRTHSRAVRALKAKFRVVGVCSADQVSPAIEAIFDEILPWPELDFFQAVRQTAEAILERRPALVLHLGVGMSPYVIALASLRLAPVQACSYGHTATTRSPAVDQMILPEDFVGSPDVWSERLTLVPFEAMPYTPRHDVDAAALITRGRAERTARKGGAIRVAVAASIMKLNPPFFAALAAAARAAETPVEYHFFPLCGVGLALAELRLRLAEQLPGAAAHGELPYPEYMERLAACDFFVCPFPYGNMNSIVDAFRVGLPGVCLDGPEAHAHADVAFFARAGLPGELAAQSREAYVAAIARLADDRAWRAACTAAVERADLEAAFYAGDERLFCAAVAALVEGAVAGADLAAA